MNKYKKKFSLIYNLFRIQTNVLFITFIMSTKHLGFLFLFWLISTCVLTDAPLTEKKKKKMQYMLCLQTIYLLLCIGNKRGCNYQQGEQYHELNEVLNCGLTDYSLY